MRNGPAGPRRPERRPGTGGPPGAPYPERVKTFDALWAELSAKVAAGADGSGTVEAVRRGVHHAGKKVVEEAAESWMAAEHESAHRAAQEISQLLYQVQVLMLARGLDLDDVYAHL
jgi:phosphoribosyl-ATP pyrophosphohydrolase